MREVLWIGHACLARYPAPIVLGLVVHVVLACVFVSAYGELIPQAHGVERPGPSSTQDDSADVPNLASLNVRLSTRPIHPPADRVKQTVLLPGVSVVRPLVGEPIRAAVLEDDTRRRVVVLSTESQSPDGAIRAYVLDDVDLERHLPLLATCSGERRCAHDRTPGTGGLGCVALCLAEVLRR